MPEVTAATSAIDCAARRLRNLSSASILRHRLEWISPPRAFTPISGRRPALGPHFFLFPWPPPPAAGSLWNTVAPRSLIRSAALAPMPHDSTALLQHWLDRHQAGDPDARAELIRHSQERLRHLTRQMLRHYPGVRRWEDTSD